MFCFCFAVEFLHFLLLAADIGIIRFFATSSNILFSSHLQNVLEIGRIQIFFRCRHDLSIAQEIKDPATQLLCIHTCKNIKICLSGKSFFMQLSPVAAAKRTSLRKFFGICAGNFRRACQFQDWFLISTKPGSCFLVPLGFAPPRLQQASPTICLRKFMDTSSSRHLILLLPRFEIRSKN